jgi:hypothetical protein
MKITITPEDAKNQKGYNHITDCLLGIAIKRQVPGTNTLEVGSQWVYIGSKGYNINNYIKITECYYDKKGNWISPRCIVEQPFDVELIPLPQ